VTGVQCSSLLLGCSASFSNGGGVSRDEKGERRRGLVIWEDREWKLGYRREKGKRKEIRRISDSGKRSPIRSLSWCRDMWRQLNLDAGGCGARERKLEESNLPLHKRSKSYVDSGINEFDSKDRDDKKRGGVGFRPSTPKTKNVGT